MKFIGNGRAAHLRPPLEHQRFVSCLRQVEGGDQPVVSAAHDSAARMRRRTANVEVLDWRPELRPPCDGAEEEQLLQRKLTLKNVAFAEAELALKIKRRDHLFVQDDVFDIGSVLGNGVDDVVAERFFLIIPANTRTQLVWSVLYEAGHYVLAGRRD